MKRPKKTLIFLILATCLGGALFPSCSWLTARQNVTRCKFKILSINSAQYALSKPRYFKCTIELGIRNPNEEEAVLDPFEWRLYVRDKEIATGKSTRQFTLPARGEKLIEVDMKIDLLKTSKSAVTSLLNAEVKYHMEATVELSTPLGSISYDVHIRKGKWSASDIIKSEKSSS